MSALEVAVAHEIVERRTHGEARNAEIAAETALGGDGLADLQLVDELEDPLPGQYLFPHRRCIKA